MGHKSCTLYVMNTRVKAAPSHNGHRLASLRYAKKPACCIPCLCEVHGLGDVKQQATGSIMPVMDWAGYQGAAATSANCCAGVTGGGVQLLIRFQPGQSGAQPRVHVQQWLGLWRARVLPLVGSWARGSLAKRSLGLFRRGADVTSLSPRVA